jgi:hypothetical protein
MVLREEARSSRAVDDMMALLSLQSAGGSFARDSTLGRLSAAFGLSDDDVARMLPSKFANAASEPDRDAAVRTAIALCILAKHFADREPLWRRADRKGRKYLAKVMSLRAPEVDAWLSSLVLRAPGEVRA